MTQLPEDFSVSFKCAQQALRLERIPDIFPASLFHTYVAPYDQEIVMKIIDPVEALGGGQFRCTVLGGDRSSCPVNPHKNISIRLMSRTYRGTYIGHGSTALFFQKGEKIIFRFYDEDKVTLPQPLCDCPVFLYIKYTRTGQSVRRTFAFKIVEKC